MAKEKILIGIEARKDEFRYVKALAEQGLFHIVQYGKELLPIGVSDSQKYVDVVQRIIDKTQISSEARVVFSVGGSIVINRLLSVPLMPREELRSALMVNDMLFSDIDKETVYFDYEIISRETKEHKQDVFLVCANKNTVDDIMAVDFILKGEKPKIESDVVALTNALNWIYQSQGKSLAYFDAIIMCHGNSATFIILQNGLPAWSRSFTFNNPGFLATNVIKSIEFFKGRTESLIVVQNMLFLGNETLKQKIVPHLNIKISDLVLKEGIIGGLTKEFIDNIVLYLTPTGLALPQELRIIKGINLHPGPEEEYSIFPLRKVVLFLLPLICVLSLFFAGSHIKLSALQTKLSAISAKTEKLKPELEQVIVSQSELIQLQKRVALMQNLLDIRTSWGFIFKDLTKIMPEGLWFTDMTTSRTFRMEGKNRKEIPLLHLKGIATRTESVIQFVSTLESIPWYTLVQSNSLKNITYHSGSDKEYGVVMFDINCNIDWKSVRGEIDKIGVQSE